MQKYRNFIKERVAHFEAAAAAKKKKFPSTLFCGYFEGKRELIEAKIISK